MKVNKREFDISVDIWLTLEKQPQFAFKSPLTPLFQRGEQRLLVFIPTLLKGEDGILIFLPPFGKGGVRGDFLTLNSHYFYSFALFAQIGMCRRKKCPFYAVLHRSSSVSTRSCKPA